MRYLVVHFGVGWFDPSSILSPGDWLIASWGLMLRGDMLDAGDVGFQPICRSWCEWTRDPWKSGNPCIQRFVSGRQDISLLIRWKSIQKQKNTNYRRVISVHVFFCAINVASFQRISFTFDVMDSSNFFEFGGSPVRASIYVVLFLFLDLPVLFTPPTSAA